MNMALDTVLHRLNGYKIILKQIESGIKSTLH